MIGAPYGGNHSLYIDGRGVEIHQVTDYSSQGQWSAVQGSFVAVQVGSGTHVAMLRHEDDFWPDNHGTRQTDLYFSPESLAIPEPATMCALGLAVAGLGGYVRRRGRG